MLFKRNRKPTPQKSPEEKLRSRTEAIAQQLYQNRLILNKEGGEKSDWELSKQIVKSPVRSALFASHAKFIQLEKRAWEPLLAWADRQALLGLFGLIGNVGIIVAVITYVGSEKQRRDAEVLNAWQTITNAAGQSGSGGRIQALEFLNASPGANWRRKFPWFCAPMPLCVWPAESLDGINLAVDSLEEEDGENNNNFTVINRADGVYLAGVQLPNAFLGFANLEGADLRYANLEGADLFSANLEGTDLGYANLEDAILSSANLEGANLYFANLEDAFLEYVNFEDADLREASLKDTILGDANFEGADLRYANLEGAVLKDANLESTILGEASLEGADLRDANLEGADLRDVNLKGTIFRDANLEGADLSFANLEGADLREANLKDTILGDANLEGAVLWAANLEGAVLARANLEGAVLLTEQIAQAKLCFTKLSPDIDLPPNRDCAELGIDPETGD